MLSALAWMLGPIALPLALDAISGTRRPRRQGAGEAEAAGRTFGPGAERLPGGPDLAPNPLDWRDHPGPLAPAAGRGRPVRRIHRA